MPVNTNWDVSRIFKSEEEFLSRLETLRKEALPALSSLRGKLSEDESLHAYFVLERKISKEASWLYRYASMKSDLDRKNVESQTDLSKVILFLQDLETQGAFAEPELIALGKEKLEAYFSAHPEDQDFRYPMIKLFRREDHVLSEKEEKILGDYSVLSQSGANLYNQLSVSDYVPGHITLKNGKEVEVSLSNWTALETEATTEEDRKAIFLSLYSYFDRHKNAYGEIYKTVVEAQLAEMKARGYESILAEHLSEDRIPVSLYETLIHTASENAEPLHKYYQIRAKALGLDHHRSYDRFVPLARSERKFTYEEARNTFFDSISAFPEDFQKKAREVTKEGYVDVYPASGKTTGAYSTGGEDMHPYILMNFNGQLEDVFTLAHESGHSIHTLYSEESQPLVLQDYTIFVAEIASTFNEQNLLDYLLTKGELSRNDSIALLQKSIDQIVSTFYRQTLFAHYEYLISKLAEKGEPLNYTVFSKTMRDLYKTYYGIDIEEEELKPLVWAYIPHLFNSPFYVYQYATSFTASMLLYENVRQGKKDAFSRYVGMLRKGGSEDPLDEVKEAGVDLTSPDAYLAVVRRMSSLVDELEKLLFEAK